MGGPCGLKNCKLSLKVVLIRFFAVFGGSRTPSLVLYGYSILYGSVAQHNTHIQYNKLVVCLFLAVRMYVVMFIRCINEDWSKNMILIATNGEHNTIWVHIWSYLYILFIEKAFVERLRWNKEIANTTKWVYLNSAWDARWRRGAGNSILIRIRARFFLPDGIQIIIPLFGT